MNVLERLEMYGVSREGKYRYGLEVYIINPVQVQRLDAS